MKKIIGLALVAGCLVAMPVMAQAAEFPAVDIATKCEYANGHTGFKKDDRPDEITMKKLILTEIEADGFTASAYLPQREKCSLQRKKKRLWKTAL